MRKAISLYSIFAFQAASFLMIASGWAGKGDKKVEGLPQLDPYYVPSQFFWLVVIFALLYIFMARSVLPAVGSTIEARRSQDDGDLDSAKEMRDEAERVHGVYEESLNEARWRAHDIFVENDHQIKARQSEILANIREKSSQDVNALEARIEKAKASAVKDMETVITDVASSAAEKILGVTADDKAVKNAVKSINKEAA